MERAEQRYRKAYAKLDEQRRRPHPNDWEVPHVPDRPKGMHRTTYERLVEDLETARRDWDGAFHATLGGFKQRLGEAID